jgi:hypothetical protein
MEEDGFIGESAPLYHVLSVGCALDLLDAASPHPVRGVAEMTAPQLIARLEALPWRDGAWAAGAWIDAWATAAHRNRRRAEPDAPTPASGGTRAASEPGSEGTLEALTPTPASERTGTLEALFGWLLTHAGPWTGMWGSPSVTAGRLQVVNGYCRLTRGSFTQFGVPVPHPERVVDAVLDDARDARHFARGKEDACNVLDVAHPLWVCTRQLGTGPGRHGLPRTPDPRLGRRPAHPRPLAPARRPGLRPRHLGSGPRTGLAGHGDVAGDRPAAGGPPGPVRRAGVPASRGTQAGSRRSETVDRVTLGVALHVPFVRTANFRVASSCSPTWLPYR